MGHARIERLLGMPGAQARRWRALAGSSSTPARGPASTVFRLTAVLRGLLTVPHPCSCGTVLAVAFVLMLAGPVPAKAAYVHSLFTFENDGDLTNGPFGTVKIEDGVGTDRLKFTVAIDTDILGSGADIHQFGFNLTQAGLGSVVVLDPSPQAFAGVTLGLSYNAMVVGRHADYDYVVDFGAGTPHLDAVMFTIMAAGLTLDNVIGADFSSQNDKPDGQFHAHVQNTSGIDVLDSESIGGNWSTAVVPVPAALPFFITALVGLGLFARRQIRRRPSVSDAAS